MTSNRLNPRGPAALLLLLACSNASPYAPSNRLLLRNGAKQQYRQQLEQQQQQEEQLRFLQSSLTQPATSCDASFLQCITVDACAGCFLEMETQSINWAGVTEDTPCEDVVGYLNKDSHCMSLQNNQLAITNFCTTFKNCVVWFDDEDDDATDNESGDEGESASDTIDCSALTECDWEGIHQSFIGNGVCNDGLDGCYNTAVCNYDGGDCCEDTCKTTESSFVECGHDGYACVDPNSTHCQTWLTNQCKNASKDKQENQDKDAADAEKRAKTKCADDQVKYRLVMYDSFGDGWDNTKITLSTKDSSTPIYSGGLETGSQGTEYICLSKQPSCYHVEAKGGIWGNEISWEIKSVNEGVSAIAGGGAPMECNFGVFGAENCDNGKPCTGKPNIQPADDPGYKELKDLFQCVEEKCLIQVGACRKDEVCDKCFHADPDDYCYQNDAFGAVADCTLCQCTENDNEDFCNKKVGPGNVFPPPVKPGDEGNKKKDPCTPAETISGGAAVINFSECVKYDQVTMMVTDFDQNHFGDLDKFEACAHSYATSDHGGHTALGCLQILVNAMNGGSSVAPAEGDDTPVPIEAIKALAMSLYKDGEDFCNCAKDASDKCPLCPSFLNFKTLLYESLDACQALDEIDCDAWREFYSPCKTNMESKFGSINFNSEEQCNYIRDNCGGVGPFPAFRRLDCDSELSSEAWQLYLDYNKSCLKGEYVPTPKPVPASTPKPVAPAPTPAPGTPGTPAPAPVPVTPAPGPKPYVPPEERGKPTAKPYVPPDSGSDNKPYVPPDSGSDSKPYVPPDSGPDSGSSSSSSSSSSYVPPETKKKRRGWFWTFFWFAVLGGGVYYYFKRRSDGFNFIRYRRMRNNFLSDDGDMYSGLAMESSTNFEPPHLPPTPSVMGGMQ